jgi:hypothetical protein
MKVSNISGAQKARHEKERQTKEEKRKQETPTQIVVDSQPEEKSTYTLKKEKPAPEPLKDGLGRVVPEKLSPAFEPLRGAAWIREGLATPHRDQVRGGAIRFDGARV